ncbi:helix-turn-helix domain-containing protein [Paraconexibacter algicola]|uniref:HTH luxR-type domain-containing protein n=1 Tax=Paraconexibacter algicola TaxID=2133960 RepID=A0A2T4UFZ4_9ACTN|nr:helix-turn-helix transcriptional regulator [Paraconexibacter algicola]PTL58174.1 hypothetical protein C7Y72_00160 [Paraconexibacter algicola]
MDPDDVDPPVADGTPEITRWCAILGRAQDVDGLFARVAALALDRPGDRAVVLTVRHGRLSAQDTGALADPASDRLRRSFLAQPVERRDLAPEAGETVTLQPIEVGGAELAVLLVTSTIAPDDARLADLAAVAALALERVLQQERTALVSAELQQLVASTGALLEELHGAPLVLPSQRHAAPLSLLHALPAGSTSVADLLSDRELEVIRGLAAGRSNRDIAQTMYVSPETVKAHVARILRKLGAQNRAEAVARFLQSDPGAGGAAR